MKSWLSRGIKHLLILSLIVPVLAGCMQSFEVGETYPLESVSGSGNETSYVYRAADRNVPEVANELAERKRPQQQSEEDAERMFLVYADEIVQVQQDPEQPEDTLIEISSREYVRQNYSPSFLEAYIIASVIGDLFDRGRYAGGDYRGYGSKGAYAPKQTYRTPTVDDKKMAPPVTVNRSGSIVRRSSDADASASKSAASPGSSASPGKIVRDGSGSSSEKSSVLTKPKKTKAPKISKRTGKIGRRR
ncbi:DUF4247 domain-containing protein [Paenibacillus sp.]|uniref:DUF4247 domain-containing protein n=1 Tax=Paenibacillus sp. TaxID=58172 RepID=UPI0028123732|nr:DUF4247 domain-containing protein [Paenibacillus sp.]